MQDFRNLKVWAAAHDLALAVYAATRAFPEDERYELVRQMRRAAVSAPTNIAEGCGSQSDANFKRYLSIAAASANELEYLLLLSRDLGYVGDPIHNRLTSKTQSVKRMLTRLIERVSPVPRNSKRD